MVQDMKKHLVQVTCVNTFSTDYKAGLPSYRIYKGTFSRDNQWHENQQQYIRL